MIAVAYIKKYFT